MRRTDARMASCLPPDLRYSQKVKDLIEVGSTVWDLMTWVQLGHVIYILVVVIRHWRVVIERWAEVEGRFNITMFNGVEKYV